MAEARVSVDLDEFNCPICLDLLKDPVSINCGHSFCMTCIKTEWDQDDRRRIYSCPLCRKNFTPRPVLGRNTMLAKMVEKLKNIQVSEESLAGPGDVECDVCVGQKHKAVKTCLVCLASYCELHFKLHNELNPGNKHKVITTSGKLTDRVCPRHNKLKELYCCDEQECVCPLCALDHLQHKVVSSHEERFYQENRVYRTKQLISQRIRETVNVLKEMKHGVQSVKKSTKTAISGSERSFTEMIKAKEKAELRYAEKVQKTLELKTEALRKRDKELDQISLVEDDIHFLQTVQRLCASAVYDPLPNITVRIPSFEKVKTSVSKLKEQMNGFCNADARISTEVANWKMIYISEPFIREDFMRYFQQPAVDMNTVSTYLSLSEKNTKLKCHATQTYNDYPDHPKRYTYMAQALCKQGLTGRSYWEVEWHDPQVYIGLSYKGVDRKGCCISVGLGHNNQSWSLCCSNSRSYFCHNDKMTDIFEPITSRIGVYLDHRAGKLSFYNVSNTMTLLHSVKTTFKEPLYPGFWVFDGSDVRVCQYDEKVSHEAPRNHEAERTEDPSMVNYLGDQFYVWRLPKSIL